MSDHRRFFVITARGEVGPFTVEDLMDEVQGKRIARGDRLRSAFGANLGTVADVLPSANRQRRTSSDRLAPQLSTAESQGILIPRLSAILLGLVLLGGIAIVLAPGRTAEPPAKAPAPFIPPPTTPTPLPAVPVLPAPVGETPTVLRPLPGADSVLPARPSRKKAISTPFENRPQDIPGPVLLWRFDNGGEGVAYHDVEAKNQGQFHGRPKEGVDLQERPDPQEPLLAWVRNGEWLKYTCRITAPGNYRWRIQARRNSANSAKPVRLEWFCEGRSLGTPLEFTGIPIEDQTLHELHAEVTLPGGVHTLQLRFSDGFIHFGDLVFTRIETPAR